MNCAVHEAGTAFCPPDCVRFSLHAALRGSGSALDAVRAEARREALTEARWVCAEIAARKRAASDRASANGAFSVASHRTSDAETADECALALAALADAPKGADQGRAEDGGSDEVHRG